MLVSISEAWGGRGEFELRSRRGYTRRFLGRSSRSDDSELDIKRSPLCPQVGDLDPYDRLAVIRRVQVRLIDFTDREWEITVTSSTDVPEREISPLEKPAEISWDSDQFEATTVFDRDGKPVTNSAGDLVLFPYEDSRWVANVSKNVARVPRWITQFNNAINSGSITVDGIRFPKRTLMCKHLRIGTQQTTKINDRDVEFRVLTFQLHVRHGGWRITHPDIGFNERKPALRPVRNRRTGAIVTDGDGLPRYVQTTVKERIRIGEPPEYPSEPQPLDEQGRVIVDPTPDDIRQIEIDRYRELPFSRLPLR